MSRLFSIVGRFFGSLFGLFERLALLLFGQQVGAMVVLTWRAAFRFKLVVALIFLLMGAVFVIPTFIKHDGSAQGFTQILITYTLSAVTGLLGFATLWLACGTLAREIEDCQLHMVMTKPISRWQIWLGKWLGIVTLNLALLALSGTTIYLVLLSRTSELKPQQQAILRNEVLVARASAREPPRDLDPVIRQALTNRLKDSAVQAMDLAFVRRQVEEMVKSAAQVVPPGHFRRWTVDLGPDAKTRLKDQPLYLRVKFFTAEYTGSSATFQGFWEIGPTEGANRQRIENSLAAESFIEFPIAPNLMDDSGKLVIDFQNWNNTALLFPLEEGFEVLYREGGFALNFGRGLGIIACWLALLAAIGLAAASRLQFPVAAFFSLAVLLVAFSGSSIQQVVEQGGIMGIDHDTGVVKPGSAVNAASVKLFSVIKRVIDVAQEFSPIDALSSGRSITWLQLTRAFAQVVVVLGGLFAVAGIVILTRREIALPV
jgi:hypothetical protein